MDQSKLLRNRMPPGDFDAQRITRNSLRAMMARPQNERIDAAAAIYLWVYSGAADAGGHSKLLLASTLTADASASDVATRIRAMASAADSPEARECDLVAAGELAVADLTSVRRSVPLPDSHERAHYVMALRLSRDPSFIAHKDECRALEAMLLAMEPARADHMARLLTDLTLRTSLFWEARWGQNAFPVTAIPDARYAAALCATTMPTELTEHVRPPWEAFMIRLPAEELLTVTAPSGAIERVERILVHQHLDEDGDRAWSYVLEGSTTMVDRTCVPTKDMCLQVDPEESDDREAEAAPLQGREEYSVPLNYMNSPRDDRSRHMAARIIVGVCMAFDTDGAVRKLSDRSKTRRGRRQPFPTKLEYVIGRAIAVDARQYVKDYIDRGGKRGPMTVQSIVRGHWKWQAHGERGSLRKFIHVEPYSRGPDDAPIAVRPHILKGASE